MGGMLRSGSAGGEEGRRLVSGRTGGDEFAMGEGVPTGERGLRGEGESGGGMTMRGLVREATLVTRMACWRREWTSREVEVARRRGARGEGVARGGVSGVRTRGGEGEGGRLEGVVREARRPIHATLLCWLNGPVANFGIYASNASPHLSMRQSIHPSRTASYITKGVAPMNETWHQDL